jgi:hypothetical protein
VRLIRANVWGPNQPTIMAAQTFRFRFQLFSRNSISAHTYVTAANVTDAVGKLVFSLKPWETARFLHGPSLPNGSFYQFD